MRGKKRRERGDRRSVGAIHIYIKMLRRQSSMAKNYMQSMMILAMAMGHTVDRPVMGMGGGTINPMEQLCQLPSDCPLDRKVKN